MLGEGEEGMWGDRYLYQGGNGGYKELVELLVADVKVLCTPLKRPWGVRVGTASWRGGTQNRTTRKIGGLPQVDAFESRKCSNMSRVEIMLEHMAFEEQKCMILVLQFLLSYSFSLDGKRSSLHADDICCLTEKIASERCQERLTLSTPLLLLLLLVIRPNSRKLYRIHHQVMISSMPWHEGVNVRFHVNHDTLRCMFFHKLVYHFYFHSGMCILSLQFRPWSSAVIIFLWTASSRKFVIDKGSGTRRGRNLTSVCTLLSGPGSWQISFLLPFFLFLLLFVLCARDMPNHNTLLSEKRRGQIVTQ